MNRFTQLNDRPDELWRLIRIRHLLNRFKCPRMKIDMIQSQRVFMIWFNKVWIDSLWCYSWKFELIRKVWHKENGQKECLIRNNESWIESSISRKDLVTQKWSFLYTTTHKTSMDHMTQWAWFARCFNKFLC